MTMDHIAAALDTETVKNIITVAAAVIGWIAARWFGAKADTEKSTWEKALEAAGSIMETFARIAEPSMTVERFEVACRGVAAVQLAKFGYDVDHLPFAIAAARDAAVYGAMKLWAQQHADPKSLQLNGLIPRAG